MNTYEVIYKFFLYCITYNKKYLAKILFEYRKEYTDEKKRD